MNNSKYTDILTILRKVIDKYNIGEKIFIHLQENIIYLA